MTAETWPPHVDGPWRDWAIPAQCWSRSDWAEDTIKIQHNVETGEWSGRTEHDQCDKRDLSDEDLAHIRAELSLEP